MSNPEGLNEDTVDLSLEAQRAQDVAWLEDMLTSQEPDPANAGAMANKWRLSSVDEHTRIMTTARGLIGANYQLSEPALRQLQRFLVHEEAAANMQSTEEGGRVNPAVAAADVAMIQEFYGRVTQLLGGPEEQAT